MSQRCSSDEKDQLLEEWLEDEEIFLDDEGYEFDEEKDEEPDKGPEL